MPPGDLPHARRASLLGTVWAEMRRMVRGPLGCLALILCIPVTLLAFLVMLGIAWWRGRQVRRVLRERVASAQEAAESAPTAAYVQMFAADASFSRDEAAQTAVPAASGRTAAELLEDALARGWIAPVGDGRLAVTGEGRAAVDRILGPRGL